MGASPCPSAPPSAGPCSKPGGHQPLVCPAAGWHPCGTHGTRLYPPRRSRRSRSRSRSPPCPMGAGGGPTLCCWGDAALGTRCPLQAAPTLEDTEHPCPRVPPPWGCPVTPSHGDRAALEAPVQHQDGGTQGPYPCPFSILPGHHLDRTGIAPSPPAPPASWQWAGWGVPRGTPVGCPHPLALCRGTWWPRPSSAAPRARGLRAGMVGCGCWECGDEPWSSRRGRCAAPGSVTRRSRGRRRHRPWRPEPGPAGSDLGRTNGDGNEGKPEPFSQRSESHGIGRGRRSLASVKQGSSISMRRTWALRKSWKSMPLAREGAVKNLIGMRDAVPGSLRTKPRL